MDILILSFWRTLLLGISRFPHRLYDDSRFSELIDESRTGPFPFPLLVQRVYHVLIISDQTPRFGRFCLCEMILADWIDATKFCRCFINIRLSVNTSSSSFHFYHGRPENSFTNQQDYLTDELLLMRSRRKSLH